MKLSILYRGPLSSCNYGCPYCPFAKRAETDAEHAADHQALDRFLAWVEEHDERWISVFFTPWGEALIRRRYQRALIRLTNLPHLEKAVIQTNLSCRLDWIEACDKRRLALWTTFHPGEVSRARFLERCLELDRRGVRFSVGVVGLKEHEDEIAALRRELPPHVYLWVNAYKRVPDYYSDDESRRLTAIDPLFPINNQRHPSQDRACHCGESVISVDGEGTIRRCHFIREPIGNLYAPDWAAALQDRPCTNATCGCHIGYVHMPDLGLYDVFGEGVLERIPAAPIGVSTELMGIKK
jgi:MoaA/NifB/PqqE/SkfB family radical SAM enzyme